MSKHPKRNQLVIERTCWVWAVSYKRSSGVFNTWNIYGSEEKAKQAVEELKKVNKLPIETHITPFDLNIEQHGIVGELRCVD